MSKACHHCGLENGFEQVEWQGKNFCCLGCKSVFALLQGSDLSDFYDLNETPGIRPKKMRKAAFAYLDSQKIQDTLLEYKDDELAVVEFHIPVIHCTSCVWLLESLSRLEPAIQQSTVQFTQKRLRVTFDHNELPLSKLAEFLSQLGYKPSIHSKTKGISQQEVSRVLIYKLVVAGFCFGNVMLLAFPEYTDAGEFWLEQNKHLFRFAMLLLSLPVLVYSALDYFRSAWAGLRFRQINIDVPIAVGLLVLFFRSVYDITVDESPGYFDSLCGLVFFMLVGKWFQQKTYSALAFDSDYGNFYPMAVRRIRQGQEEIVLLNEVQVGDELLVRNEELVPADAQILSGEGAMDNSFITGESRWIAAQKGDSVFAGAIFKGQEIQLRIQKEIQESYLTKLWQNAAFNKKESQMNRFVNVISAYFTYVILLVALGAAVYWFFVDASQIALVVTAILIVACPCALALSSPFTYGSLMRILGKNAFFLKDTSVLERMAEIEHIAFDKTGTLTDSETLELDYVGEVLSVEEKNVLFNMAMLSDHPLSRGLVRHLQNGAKLVFNTFEEIPGKGLKAVFGQDVWKLGSSDFLGQKLDTGLSQFGVTKNGEWVGYWTAKPNLRPGLSHVLTELKNYTFSVISGDNTKRQKEVQEVFPAGTNMRFAQSPQDKLNFIENHSNKTMMLGDGLNDAGALKASYVGVAIADDLNRFTPACDAILEARSFALLPKFLRAAMGAKYLVWSAFVISFLYNVVGLAFAVSGNLSPVVAAILMPVSSITIVIFTTASSRILAYRLGLKT